MAVLMDIFSNLIHLKLSCVYSPCKYLYFLVRCSNKNLLFQVVYHESEQTQMSLKKFLKIVLKFKEKTKTTVLKKNSCMLN